MRFPLTPSSRRWLPLAAAFFVPLVLVCALCWPLPVQLHQAWAPSLFGASHAWLGDHLWRALTEGESLHSTLRAGYPWERSAAFIGWLPLLAMLPLRLVMGPLGAFHLALLLSLPLSSLAAWPLLRRWTGAGPWAVAAGCVAFAVSPFALGTFSTGELPKLQIGLIPLFLYALDRARCQERGWSWALASGLLATVTVFTSPYFGLCLPLLCVALLAVDALRRRRLLRPLVCGLSVLAGLSPAGAYYSTLGQQVIHGLYLPAGFARFKDALPEPHPVASLQDLLLGIPAQIASGWDTRHVAYLGSMLALALLLLALRRREARRGRWAAAALLVGGGLLSLGPRLYLVDQVTGVPLPALLLCLAHYPLAVGGMFYRLAALGSLGLALWLVAECARRPRLAWILLALQLGDAVRASAPWPLEVQEVPAVEILAELEGDDGAVFNLPFDAGLEPNQRALLLASFHGRPTTGLPRISLPSEQAVMHPLWKSALSADDPATALGELGVRYLMSDGSDLRDDERLTKLFGPPDHQQGWLAVWDLGPTQLRPRPLAELEGGRKLARPPAGHRPPPQRGEPRGP